MEEVGYIKREDVIGTTILVMYRVEGNHNKFGRHFYAVYSNKICLGEFKYDGWANQFYDVALAHLKATRK